MALINLNINSFKADLGGIANRLVDGVVNKLEQKLENAVEDAFASGLKKIGLSDSTVSAISARFGDAFSVGRADDFFRTSTSEQNRVSQQDIENNFLPTSDTETTLDAVYKINAATTKPGILQFPDQIGKYYMMMDFQNYYRPSPLMKAVLQHFETIILPIPRDLKETFENRVEAGDQGAMGGLADVITDIGRGAGSKATKGAFAVAYNFAVQAAADFGKIIGQTLGSVPNPHVQALFSGVNLRTHTFQWTFAPRNPNESAQLQNIIRAIKKNSLPAYSTTGTAALDYPPLVAIKLVPWNDLITFKNCLVSSVNVNYAPSGLPSFFAGTNNLPTMIQLEITLMETEIHTAKDYGLKDGERSTQLEKVKDAAVQAFDNISNGQFTASTAKVGQFADNVSKSAADAATNIAKQTGTPK
jgi:hypothetical protein